jgi:RNA polymerase sigma factor (sigma-70 family)
MSAAYDNYIYCSPFLNVASLDHILSSAAEDETPFDPADSQPSPEIGIDRQRAEKTIHAAVDKLPPRQRSVIHAIFFLGHSVSETARMLKVTAAAVVKLRNKALKHLMSALAPVRDMLFA